MGLLVRWVPKVGLLKALGFKLPTPKTEDLYVQSVNKTVEDYRMLLHQVGNGNLQLPNVDCDTGHAVAPGEYALCDGAYARLLELSVKRGLESVPPDLRSNVLAFYADPPTNGRGHSKAWRRTAEEIEALKAGADSAIALALRQRLLAPPFKLESPKAKAG